MDAEGLMNEWGDDCKVAHKDQFTRRQKDILRGSPSPDLIRAGDYFVLRIREEPTSKVASTPSEKPVAPVVGSDEPVLADLEKLTVAGLRDLADQEALDVSDLKLKADLVGRLAAHFGVDL